MLILTVVTVRAVTLLTALLLSTTVLADTLHPIALLGEIRFHRMVPRYTHYAGVLPACDELSSTDGRAHSSGTHRL